MSPEIYTAAGLPEWAAEFFTTPRATGGTRSATEPGAAPVARQQPVWADTEQLRRVRAMLAEQPGLVTEAEVRALRTELAGVATGRAQVIQAGDCAEDPDRYGHADVARKVAMLHRLATRTEDACGRPVLRVGRIAGQFAKPRSKPTELVDGAEIPVYRGHMVNGPEPTAEARTADPLRLAAGYMAADAIVGALGWRGATPPADPVWTSHEALLLDYELPLVRPTADGRWMSASTHWPWVGERTRQVDGAHVSMLARLINPVAVKIGPTVEADELRALCERLDPRREPGRLTLIIRMGARLVAERLPALVRAVRAEGHPVIWLADPMHGNTVVAPRGTKTRFLRDMRRELSEFRVVLGAAGEFPGGVHLEATPDTVAECVRDESEIDRAGAIYTSLCDPRLTVEQALEVLAVWCGDDSEPARDRDAVTLP
ncbi:3-deoxy-7-phosphoheptulonate synthase [Nocardia arizonensis]|uniref:3-deoxy-7-phosphoheptulonate synthase n=1 Tax=Nocardia arizonensis TaxID=1141647 RepID=UPI000A91C050|nr:3-deoxy-7-phosphoheptulonate synthase [Nocardia arizonensis]